MSPRASAPLALEYVLLGLLAERPMHGYDLFQQLASARGIALVWKIKQSLLYAMLEKLEEKGLLESKTVTAESYPPRKVFHLTGEGQAAFQNWTAAPVTHAREMRQEFLAKLVFARRASPLSALCLVQAQRKICQGWLEKQRSAFQALKDSSEETLVLSYRINQLEAMLAWLETQEAELRLETTVP